MDLIGPITESLYNNKYILSILDDHSRYGWILFIKNKSDTFETFYNWFSKIKNIFNTRIKFIRSNNGKEFKNAKFYDFCKMNGIQQQFTIPYNPQQNGRIERFNGTIISTAKVLLKDTKLSRQFWEDAVATANYIHNRIPHHGIKNKISFDYSNLRYYFMFLRLLDPNLIATHLLVYF